jgi:2-oxoglutarate dehydrogenase E1 component
VDKERLKSCVLYCKFYYDIIAEREKKRRKDVAVVRIEQLFPLPVEQLKAIIAKYPNADDCLGAEEPKTWELMVLCQ